MRVFFSLPFFDNIFLFTFYFSMLRCGHGRRENLKNIFRALGLGIVFSTLFPRESMTAGSTSADGNVSVTIIEQASIESEADIDFGTLISPGYQGTFTVNTSGLLSCATNWVCTGTPSAGKFKILSNTASVDVSYQDGVLSDGLGHTLTVKVDGQKALSVVNGSATLYVGAELEVPYGTSAGLYSTSNTGGTPYKVTINY